MNTTTSEYFEYTITVTEDGGRFTARVTRAGGMIEHTNGQVSEVWAAPSSGSLERAVQVAQSAIDSDRIR